LVLIPAEFLDQLAQIPLDSGQTFSLSERSDLGAGNNDEVVVGLELACDRPESLTQQALHPVASNRAAHAATNRDPEAGPAAPFLSLRWFSAITRKRVEDEMPVRGRATVAIDPIEFGATRQASPLLRHGHRASNREAGTSLAATSLQHGLTRTRSHPRSETVRAGTLAFLRLIGALQRIKRSGSSRSELLPAHEALSIKARPQALRVYRLPLHSPVETFHLHNTFVSSFRTLNMYTSLFAQVHFSTLIATTAPVSALKPPFGEQGHC
jgi:hypothetical protein